MIKSDQDKFYQLLGDRIRDARKLAGLKQEAFASYLDLSRASIVNIEKGRQHPAVHLLVDIARILRTSVSDLIPDVPTQDNQSMTNWTRLVDLSANGNSATTEILTGFLKELKSSK